MGPLLKTNGCHVGILLPVSVLTTLYTVSQKTVQNCFCQNFVKFCQFW